jgi:hypothetical protein
MKLLIMATARLVMRWPFLSLSVAAHVALLALLFYFGSYQPELRQQEQEVAASLRATSSASTAKRLQDLQTIKQLLEKSADKAETGTPPEPAASDQPQTPQEMLEHARELSQAIEALDEQIREEELAELIGEPAPKVRETETPQEDEVVAKQDVPEPVTEEMAAREVAELEAEARETLARRQERLEAKANGVPIQGREPGSGQQGAGAQGAGEQGKGQGMGQGLGERVAGEHGAGARVGGESDGNSQASVRAEIADFIARDQGLERRSRTTAYEDPSNGFFHLGQLEIPAVDASSMVRGRGRVLGAGGEYANRVYLNTWYLIGPFPGRHNEGLFDNPSYPPEKAVLLDAVYFGKDKRLLKWRYVSAENYPLVPPDLAEDSVYYGYTEVFVDQACDLWAWIGVDDDAQIYLNERLVWEGGNVNKGSYFHAVFNTSNTYLRDYNRTEGKRLLHFNKGRNRIFFKMSNGPNNPFLSMVLTR